MGSVFGGVSGVISPYSGVKSDLKHHGHDHGPAAVGFIDPLAHRPAHDLLELVNIGGPMSQGFFQG